MKRATRHELQMNVAFFSMSKGETKAFLREVERKILDEASKRPDIGVAYTSSIVENSHTKDVVAERGNSNKRLAELWEDIEYGGEEEQYRERRNFQTIWRPGQ